MPSWADLCDFEPSGLWFLDPDPNDETAEIECPIVTDDDGEPDYDGRR